MDLRKIVILDGYTLNPGDLSWESLRALGDCQIWDRTSPEQVVERARGAEIVLTNKTPLTRDQISQLPCLKYVGVLATGVNIIDLKALQERGIPATHVPGYGAKSVAQAAMALLLEWTHGVGVHHQSTRSGDWCRSFDFSYWKQPLVELDGKIMGIIGFGEIGQAMARMADAFGMKVWVYSPRKKVMNVRPVPVEWVELETLFRESDVLSLHCPLTPETQGLVNAERLKWMKPTAFLINTARGALVDEAALADALHRNVLAGAGLDVLSTEPPLPHNPLWTAPRCFITPHLAWATLAARRRLLDTAVHNLTAFLAGKWIHVVNNVSPPSVP